MAHHYIHEMRCVQPQGPYALAGFCFGAIVAFEMAQQLRRQGQEVRVLVSFDGPAPRYDQSADPTRSSARSLSVRLFDLWNYFRRIPLAEKVSLVREKVVDHCIAWTANSQYRIGDFCRSRGLPVPAGIRRIYFYRNNAAAEKKYLAKVYPGRMTIFETEGRFSDQSLGWEGLAAGGLQIFAIPGEFRNHRDLMTGDFVRVVAPLLKKLLRESHGDAGDMRDLGAELSAAVVGVEATASGVEVSQDPSPSVTGADR